MFRRRQSTPQPITVGSVLNDRYRLEDQLGEELRAPGFPSLLAGMGGEETTSDPT